MLQTIPKDPIMLLSFTNTQLRDHFSSLTEFCKAFMVDEALIQNKLNTVDYYYDQATNQFI